MVAENMLDRFFGRYRGSERDCAALGCLRICGARHKQLPCVVGLDGGIIQWNVGPPQEFHAPFDKSLRPCELLLSAGWALRRSSAGPHRLFRQVLRITANNLVYRVQHERMKQVT